MKIKVTVDGKDIDFSVSETSEPKKDTLAERLRKAAEINKDEYYSWWCRAEEAKKWAREVMEKYMKENEYKVWSIGEMIERLQNE